MTMTGQSQIDENILRSYQQRTILDVHSLHWANADHSVLNAMVLFEELSSLGSIPFSTGPESDTLHGREIWDKAVAGDLGLIAEYVPLTKEQLREQMPNLEKWRFDTILDLEPGLREKIYEAIDKWPEPKRTIGKNKIRSITSFRRADTLFDEIGSDTLIGKSPDDIDIMWQEASALT